MGDLVHGELIEPVTRRQVLSRGSAVGLGSLAASPSTASLIALTPTPVESSDYTASGGDFVPVDASTGSVTITLPAAPGDQAQVGIKVIAIAVPNVVTVACGGSDTFDRAGGPTSLALASLDQGVILQYEAGTHIWYVEAGVLSLAVARGAAKLGTDGTVGGPSGSALSISVANLSSPSSGQAPVFDGSAWVGKQVAIGLAAETPELHGAVGDGTTDDTAALKSWIASGKHLALTPGKTYLHRQQINFAIVGQVLDGNGSVLKRVAQAVTTTTTTITSGVTSSITVAATSGGAGAGAWTLQVGDQIVVQQGAATNFDPTARKITKIAGNVITISGTFGISLAGRINVYHGWQQIGIQVNDARLTNVTLDGNSANWSWGRWQHTIAIATGGSTPTTSDNIIIEHCRIKNQYGDAILSAGYGGKYLHNKVENIMGRGIVFGGLFTRFQGTQAMCMYNRFINTNQDPLVAGNDGNGAIDFSQGGPSTLIHGNYIDGGVDGIGSLRSWHNSQVTISQNEFRNLTGYGINGIGSGNMTAKDVTIANNRLYGCGIDIENLSAPSCASRWRITGNQIIGGPARLFSASDFTFTDNEITPMLPPVTLTVTAQMGGGTFVAATYFWQITATNASGETVGSEEVSAVIARSGAALIGWSPVSNATGYKIYRATTTGGETGATSLVTTVAATPGQYVAGMLSYTDTGAATTVGACPTVDTTFSTIVMIRIGASRGNIENLICSRNRVKGGFYGMQTNGAMPMSNVQFHDNHLIGQLTGGIYISASPTYVAFTVRHNTVIADAGAAAAWVGITIAGPLEVSNNAIDMTAGSLLTSSAKGINVTGVTGARVLRNTVVRAGTAAGAITLQPSAIGAVCANNITDKAINDSGTTTIKWGNHASGGARSGTVTLTGTTAVKVVTAEVQAAGDVRFSRQTISGTAGNITVGTVTPGANFYVISDQKTDVGLVNWWLDH